MILPGRLALRPDSDRGITKDRLPIERHRRSILRGSAPLECKDSAPRASSDGMCGVGLGQCGATPRPSSCHAAERSEVKNSSQGLLGRPATGPRPDDGNLTRQSDSPDVCPSTTLGASSIGVLRVSPRLRKDPNPTWWTRIIVDCYAA